ncbi:hypothetical protein P152DRAFT_477936 [Eremomyces bilateralis CBS 781.70]|uniref:MICOS complex subunit MIC60 n=1 Tax=Eremomyces bilateralis CBS 781.70 TaxID=1392243 RepID=A0A6G1GFJ9_9PEZI|nr:uncharacterized protein P152DRAFT_477936 [Eremomyces bilateralis CBS 781.70]KAF1816848.1 hypothetical protein P152DRAFT_477936 [Eremomyces bilateralis CBS 781.70]
MLRAALLRSRGAPLRVLGSAQGAQWQPVAQRFVLAQNSTSRRAFASKNPDETVLPGSKSSKASVETAPPDPRLSPANGSPSQLDGQPVPRTPPSPAEVKAARSPSIPPTQPPTGTGTASVAPPIKPRKKRRPLRFLLLTALLSALGYAGGVYYALVSDNFHDFFTEYVPFGEDAVGYFEEREFRKRFQPAGSQPRLYQQVRGESKVNIPERSGVSSKLVDEATRKSSDLGAKGRHMSALEDPSAGKSKPAPAAPVTPEAQKAAPESTSHALLPTDNASREKTIPAAETPKAEAAKPVQLPLIDHINIEGAEEAVIQDVVKVVNDIIAVVNADNATGKYSTTIQKAKESIAKVREDLIAAKVTTERNTEEQLKALHSDFDAAAKEFLRRQDEAIREVEAKWRDEYESERELLSKSYQDKLRWELDIAEKLHEQKLKNERLSLAIGLNDQFAESVRSHVESERNGRLGRLSELEADVKELEKLTGEWNSVVDSNLQTQHLIVAVEAVRSNIERADRPRPFINELVALKEVASNDPVVNAAIASINPAAYQKGIPTPAQLIDRFRRVSAEVRKAALLPEHAGVASHVASLAMSKLMFKKQGLPVGDDVESILTRTEALLEEGNLDRAAREMNGLKGWAKTLSNDWVGECRKVLEVRQALDVIATEARLKSLLVD